MTTKTLDEWVAWAERIDEDLGQWEIPLEDIEGNFEKFEVKPNANNKEKSRK